MSFLETRANNNIGIFAALVGIAASVVFSLIDIIRQGFVHSVSLWLLGVGCVLLSVLYLLGRKFFGPPLVDALKARVIVKEIMSEGIERPDEAMRKWRSKIGLISLMKSVWE